MKPTSLSHIYFLSEAATTLNSYYLLIFPWSVTLITKTVLISVRLKKRLTYKLPMYFVEPIK